MLVTNANPVAHSEIPEPALFDDAIWHLPGFSFEDLMAERGEDLITA
jgi:hypothetical protein